MNGDQGKVVHIDKERARFNVDLEITIAAFYLQDASFAGKMTIEI